MNRTHPMITPPAALTPDQRRRLEVRRVTDMEDPQEREWQEALDAAWRARRGRERAERR